MYILLYCAISSKLRELYMAHVQLDSATNWKVEMACMLSLNLYSFYEITMHVCLHVRSAHMKWSLLLVWHSLGIFVNLNIWGVKVLKDSFLPHGFLACNACMIKFRPPSGHNFQSLTFFGLTLMQAIVVLIYKVTGYQHEKKKKWTQYLQEIMIISIRLNFKIFKQMVTIIQLH